MGSQLVGKCTTSAEVMLATWRTSRSSRNMTSSSLLSGYWGLVLKCYELRTRQHKMLMIKDLRPSKHYLR
jgi:hypothetical protein